MKRIVFHAPDEMYEAVERLAKKRRAPLSAIIREALEEYLGARGIEVSGRVVWGKPSEDATEPGQPLAGPAR